MQHYSCMQSVNGGAHAGGGGGNGRSHPVARLQPRHSLCSHVHALHQVKHDAIVTRCARAPFGALSWRVRNSQRAKAARHCGAGGPLVELRVSVITTACDRLCDLFAITRNSRNCDQATHFATYLRPKRPRISRPVLVTFLIRLNVIALFWLFPAEAWWPRR